MPDLNKPEILPVQGKQTERTVENGRTHFACCGSLAVEFPIPSSAGKYEDVRSVVEKSDGFSSRRSASVENQIPFPQRKNRHASMSI